MATKNIQFDEGFKEYTINGDENRVIRVDTADIALTTRAVEAQKQIDAFMKRYEDIKIKADGTADIEEEAAIEAVKEMTDFVCGQIDYIFNSKVSDIVFNGASPLSTRNGIALYERFVNAMLPIIEADLKAENKAAQKRVDKYTKQAQRFKNKL